MEAIKSLKYWLECHRECSFLTCQENCICWEVEKILNNVDFKGV